MRRSSAIGNRLLQVAITIFWAYLLLHIIYHHRRNSASLTVTTRQIRRQHWQAVQSWKLNNPSWEHRFYDDVACKAFVAEHFPQWLDAYNALPLAVEQADFFR